MGLLNLPTAHLDKYKKGRAFNPEKVTAHTAIIPVQELQIKWFYRKARFTEIAQQYFIQFLPEKAYQQATVTLACNDYQFKATARKITDYGWAKIVADDEAESEDHSVFNLLSSLNESNQGICSSVDIKRKNETLTLLPLLKLHY